MHLFILTTASDTALAAVTSATDSTLLDEMPQVVLGDKVPLEVDFTDGSAAPAWASDGTYTLEAAIGWPDSSERYNLAETSSFTLDGSTREGGLDLSGAQLRNEIRTRFQCRRGNTVPMALQLRVTTPDSEVITYALIPLILRLSVL